jgi:hypothetical protein
MMRLVCKFPWWRKFVTSPTPNERHSNLPFRRFQAALPSHSIPDSNNSSSPYSTLPTTPTIPLPLRPSPGDTNKSAHEHAIDFATHSWDLATGGLKTLTAKRELPARPDRRTVGAPTDELSRSYLFALVILACLILMLVGGGVVLFVMLQT